MYAKLTSFLYNHIYTYFIFMFIIHKQGNFKLYVSFFRTFRTYFSCIYLNVAVTVIEGKYY